MRALRSLAVFFPLAFLISWYPFILGKKRLVHTSGGINPLGPAVAALIVAGGFCGWRGLKELLARYLAWRAGWSDYLIAILLTGDNDSPSAAFAGMDAKVGMGNVQVVASGARDPHKRIATVAEKGIF